MKNISIFFAGLLFSAIAMAQDSTSAPYLRFPTLPPFRLLQVDSTSYFTKEDLPKKHAVLIILFSPDCEHCQHETEQIIARINDFKKIEVVMATSMSFDLMKKFYQKYDLGRFENIRVGRDYQFILPSFFMIRNLPYLAMYDKKGKLLTTFEGTMKIDDILKAFD
jgi:thiol-disulfide isomerase/thioredoxin